MLSVDLLEQAVCLVHNSDEGLFLLVSRFVESIKERLAILFVVLLADVLEQVPFDFAAYASVGDDVFDFLRQTTDSADDCQDALLIVLNQLLELQTECLDHVVVVVRVSILLQHAVHRFQQTYTLVFLRNLDRPYSLDLRQPELDSVFELLVYLLQPLVALHLRLASLRQDQVSVVHVLEVLFGLGLVVAGFERAYDVSQPVVDLMHDV